MPVLLIIAPLVGVLILNLPARKFMNLASFWLGLIFCLFQVLVVIFLSTGQWQIGQLEQFSAPLLQSVFNWPDQIDPMSRVMLLSIGLVSGIALMVGREWLRDRDLFFLFANLTILAIAGLNGIVLSGDLFTLYVFLEIAAVTSVILISFQKGLPALEGAFKYLLLSSFATALILSSVALLLMVTGSTSFSSVSAALTTSRDSGMVAVALALFVIGLLIKSGLMPFHGWLPDAYSSAPAPVSILLAGIITKTTGLYTILRLTMSVFRMDPSLQHLLLVIGSISIVLGALAALGQIDFKRILAYSSISQMGYVIIGLASGNDIAVAGAILHLFNHAVFKSLLFVNATAVELQAGTRQIDRLGGISENMPITGVTSTIAFLSTAGIPPLGGFWSKLLIIVGLWKAGFPIFAAIAVLASLITLAYFLVLQRNVFFGKLREGLGSLHEAGGWIIVSSILLALITLFVGLGAPWLFQTFLIPIRSIL